VTFVVTGVEEVCTGKRAGRAQLARVTGEELLDLITRIPHLFAVGTPDGKRATAIGIECVVHQAITHRVWVAIRVEHNRIPFIVGAITRCPGNVESTEDVVIPTLTRITGHSTAVGKGVGIQQRARGEVAQLWRQVTFGQAAIKAFGVHQMLESKLFNKTLAGIASPVRIIIFTPGAGVAFIGGYEIANAIYLISCDGIRQVETTDSDIGSDADAPIFIAGIHTIANAAVIFKAQKQNVGNS